MSKEIYISSTPHETRLAIVENDDLTEIYYERENEYTLAGSIYNGKVTRVLPGMQSSFVDVGLERDAFLYITDFMEEAGDSAEFDSGDGASGSRRGGRDDRASRDDRGTARDDRGGSREDRGSRDDAPSPSAQSDGNEHEAAGAVSTAQTPARNDRNDRGEREGGGRRRRGGNRDGRGGSRDVADERNRNRPAEIPAAPPAEVVFDTPPVVRSGYAELGSDNPGGEIGEGAPGADGSRRWRGRRGRRRGRSSSQREESQALQQPATAQDPLASGAEAGLGHAPTGSSAEAEDIEENFDQEYDNNFDLDASAAPLNPSPQAKPTAPQELLNSGRAGNPSRPEPSEPSDTANRPKTFERQAGQARSDRSDRPERQDRGDRDSREGGRRDRGGHEGRAPRAPRGFAPSRALYGVDSADADGQPDLTSGGAAVEPLILPGESLSKYRKGEDQQSSSVPHADTPTASEAPAFTLGAAWDGGNVLPGETIRPRSNAGSASADRSGSDRSSSDRHSEGRGSRDRRDDRRGRNDRPDRNDPSGSPDCNRLRSQSTHATPSIQALADQTAHANPSTSSIPPPKSHEPEQVQQHTEAAHARASIASTAAEFHGGQSASAEYEPKEASASVRFDPSTRREFRQSAPVADEVEGPLSDEHHATFAETPEEVSQGHASSSTPAVHSIAHSITPESGAPLVPISSQNFGLAASEHVDSRPFGTMSESALSELAPLPEAAPAHDPFLDEVAPSHQFTSISNTGDMLTETPAPPMGEVSEPTSPLHHETAILDAFESPQSSSQASSDNSSSTSSSYREPDEEVFEEKEDFKATTLHASSIEEMDYEEEETLEGAADLGTMIREMSIDQITRTGDEQEDEDILEEEDAVDDHFNGSYEEPGDEEDDETGRPFTESGDSQEHDDLPRVPATERAYAAETSLGDASSEGQEPSRDANGRSSRRDGGGRRDGRRDGRGRDRARSTGGSGDRSTGRPSRRDGRHSAQTTNLPAISDLLKPGQEVLVQIAKEPIAKKGARITSHIALPGRFLVFMPTVNHTGVSRKIESDGERRRLKEILLSEKGEASGGFIVRTAASGASEEELRSDLRFLLNLWADIKQRSESSKSPALIYHDLNLVERILRDQVTDTFSAIWVDTETEYERVLRFLQRFQPSLIRRVKLYSKEVPLFEQFGITEEINKALRSKVWLKSGGSIVINQTEALVAIDINTGKYVGKTARLEDTIVKTNLDAIPEIVRQIRLRDLGGIIIIDFIDMDERKNRTRVMTALEDELKKDRAPSKVLQFNDFGLVAITRKRVKQSLERTLSSTCNVCQGTGMTKSPVTVCNDIYIEMRKMQKHLDRGDVMLRVNPEVVKQLKATGTRWLQEMEEMVGKTILVKSDPSLHPEQFDIH